MGKTKNYKTRAPQAHDRDPRPEAQDIRCCKCGGANVQDCGPTSGGNGFRGNVIVCRDCGQRQIFVA